MAHEPCYLYLLDSTCIRKRIRNRKDQARYVLLAIVHIDPCLDPCLYRVE